MIIAKLIGGLGNQLFQYAVARHLAEINNVNLKLDISSFDEYKLHKYSLHYYKIIEEFATKEDVEAANIQKEKHFHFDVTFKSIPDNSLISGYWQSSKYFDQIANIIFSEFELKNHLTGKNLQLQRSIFESNSVSLHIRRGDYVANTYGDQIFDSLDLDYYHRALRVIAEHEPEITVFAFSDDPDWVKKNLILKHKVVYVDHNCADTNYADLQLMSLCKHNIIANSSFSWWGGWLNKNPNKIVIAPKVWFNKNVRNLDPKDLIPASWLKL